MAVVLSLERCLLRSQFNPLNCERKAGVETPCSTFPGTPCSSAHPTVCLQLTLPSTSSRLHRASSCSLPFRFFHLTSLQLALPSSTIHKLGSH